MAGCSGGTVALRPDSWPFNLNPFHLNVLYLRITHIVRLRIILLLWDIIRVGWAKALLDLSIQQWHIIASHRILRPLYIFVSCSATNLFDVVDRQNAHSMTCAVRGVVEFYKAVKREKELHQEILVFSISHDYRSMRIYDHYAIIEEEWV